MHPKIWTEIVSRNCEIAAKSVKFLGISITNDGIPPQAEKIQKFSKKITMPKTTEQVKTNWLRPVFQYFYNKFMREAHPILKIVTQRSRL